MTDSDEDRGRSRRLGADDQGWLSTDQVLSGQMIERSGNDVCGLQRAQGVLVQPQNQGRWFLPVWPQNRWLQFLWFGLKTTRSGFPICLSKPAVAV
jgi:hypothetical protein